VQSSHNLTSTEARNGLVILEEAHMVLQFATPTRVDQLMEDSSAKGSVSSSIVTRSKRDSKTEVSDLDQQ